ncbi:MAG TPA: sugar ABC transporter permease [Kofleriaceae bacterium]|nr:sugar ABC transporter permease [Kofleriaceae bacterium]
MTTRPAAAWAFVSPALVAIAACFVIPVVAALALSFTDFDIYGVADRGNVRFIGLDNYRRLVASPVFWTALANTCVFVFVGGPLSIAVSLATALLLDAGLARATAVFRTALFAPVVTTVVAVAVIWRYLFHARYGYLDHVLGWLGLPAIDWLGDPRWSMPAVIVFAVWKNFGANMIVFVAGLQSIPAELYEAARIDGATRGQQLRFITLPQLAPTMLLVTLLTMVGYFQLFAEPYVMTRGGPAQSTTSVLYVMFEEGFKWWNLGFASAVAFVLFAIMLGGTALQLGLARRWSRP